jgi:ankyrin repeat protein
MLAAACNPDPAVVDFLLDSGANAKAADAAGQTAYEWAIVNPALTGTATLARLKKACGR